jgi:hypothetical protein
MLSLGHQVGCHGLSHDGTEDYYSDSIAVQTTNLSRAKSILEDAMDARVECFRAPEFRISPETFRALEDLKVSVDLSICSQRLPLLSSQIGNYHWLFSPRAPYHPSRTNPYSKGDLTLLEIPTSAILLPLMSALNSVSVTTAEVITNMLRYEAEFISKPIVYQCHPEDFILVERAKQRTNISWQSLIPTRHGIPLRWAFQETGGNAIYRRNQEYLDSLVQTDAFQFFTVHEYLKHREHVGDEWSVVEGSRSAEG